MIHRPTFIKKYVLCSVVIASVLLIVSSSAYASEILDPFFTEGLLSTPSAWNTCPAGCASAGLGVDPLSGITTLEFIFNATIPSVVAGDVEVQEFGTSTIGDLIRFENVVNPAGASQAVAFIFSNDIGGGYAADVGLPGSFQANHVTLVESSAGQTPAYTPTSIMPGFNTGGSATTYALQSSEVPEPASLLLFGTGAVGLRFLMGRRRKNRRGAA